MFVIGNALYIFIIITLALIFILTFFVVTVVTAEDARTPAFIVIITNQYSVALFKRALLL